jgi:hypothetical protein
MNFRNKLIFYGELLAPRPTPKAGGSPLVGCPRLLIQYIRRYPPYLEAVSSIRNLRTHHVVVTRDPPEGNRSLGRPRRRWADNIKIDLREIGWDGMDWIDLAQDRDQWRVLVNTVMNLRVPYCWEVLEWLHNWQVLRKDSVP